MSRENTDGTRIRVGFGSSQTTSLLKTARAPSSAMANRNYLLFKHIVTTRVDIK